MSAFARSLGPRPRRESSSFTIFYADLVLYLRLGDQNLDTGQHLLAGRPDLVCRKQEAKHALQNDTLISSLLSSPIMPFGTYVVSQLKRIGIRCATDIVCIVNG